MEDLTEALARIAARYHLREVYVFGSRAGEIRARVKAGETVEPTDEMSQCSRSRGTR